MPMTRQQIRAQAERQRYEAERHKPPTRKQAQAWLAPIRKALAELRTGEVDSHRGYAITRIHWADNDFARIDHAINGFLALMDNLMGDTLDTWPMRKMSQKLAAGILLTLDEVDTCILLLKKVEDRLMQFTRAELKSAADTEMIKIELEQLGLLEAA